MRIKRESFSKMAARTALLLFLVSTAVFAVSANKTTLIAYATLEKPFVEVSSGGEYTGLFVDLLDKISKNIGKKIDIEVLTGPSYRTEQSHWTGIMQKVISKEADLGGPLTITSIQERVVDHTKPFMSSGIVPVAKKSKLSALKSFWLFLKPFRAETWVIIVIITLLACGLRFFLAKRWAGKGKTSKPSPELQCFRCFFYSYALLVSFLYVAHLTAIIPYASMTATATTLNTVEDLAEQTEVQYGVVRNGHAHNFFRLSSVPMYERMYRYMNTTSGVLVDTVEEGIEKVRSSNGDYVFIMDSSVTANYYVNQEPCDLQKVGQSLTAQGLAIVTPIGSQYRDILTLAILQLAESGVLHQLENRWLHEDSSCEELSSVEEPKNGRKVVAMGPDGTLGPVLLLLLGIIVSGAIRLFRMRRKKTKEPIALEEDNEQH